MLSGVGKGTKEVLPQLPKAPASQVMVSICNKFKTHFNRDIFFIRPIFSQASQLPVFIPPSIIAKDQLAIPGSIPLRTTTSPQYCRPARQRLFYRVLFSQSTDNVRFKFTPTWKGETYDGTEETQKRY